MTSGVGLRVADRCDRCGAQAYVAVRLFGTVLLFCNHHFTKHADSILDQGGEVVADNREALRALPPPAL